MGSSPRSYPRLRRYALALLIGSGCVAGFDPPSKVNSLRIFAVIADKPYANPGDEVTFTMTLHDGYPPPEEGPRQNIQIVWLGGCFNPPGDQYFGCYEQIGELLGSLASFASNPEQLPFDPLTCVGPEAECCLPPDDEHLCFGINDTQYKLKLPDDIVSSRPPPATGPHYGLAYVFFAACAGARIGLVTDPGGRASSFPIGCFDEENRRLGPESFIAGYTQIYVFADGRPNNNPEIQGISLDGAAMSEDFAEIPTVKACPLTEDERRVGGCGQQDPYSDCTTYDVEVLVDPGVAELDPESTGKDGSQLTEAVWVDYYADQGDLQPGIKLVNDAVKGFNEKREVTWIPPAEPTVVNLWAVLHDARGGAAVAHRLVRVE
jgi:hypothetical protein